MNIFKNWYDYLIIIIVIIKILNYIFFALYLFFKVFNMENSKIFKDIIYLKKLTFNLFNNLMAVLLVYLFNPFYPVKELDNIVRYLLFVYAFIIVIQSQWITNINEDQLIIYLKKIYNIDKINLN